MILIPAKYSSTRTPKKNFRAFYNGFSLLQIAIIRSVVSNCGPVFISSENAEAVKKQIAQMPLVFQREVSVHQRIDKLARDPATILDVMMDFLNSLPGGELPNALAVVLPTSPFNNINAIKKAWRQFLITEVPKLISVSKSSKPPFNAWIKIPESNSSELIHAFPDNPYRLTQSTACPQTFLSNGCISIYAVPELMGGEGFNRTAGFEMPQISSIDIDFEYEFDLAKLAFPTWGEDLSHFQK